MRNAGTELGGVVSLLAPPGFILASWDTKVTLFRLVAGHKCHDIADHFSYAGSGCHKWYQSP
ncbi:hypothetical protein YC2023_082046 [Brassica napus]